MSDGLRKGMKVDVDGDTATVSIRIPIIVPGPRRRPPARRAQRDTSELTWASRIASSPTASGARTAPPTASATTAGGCWRRSTSPRSPILSEEQRRARLERVVGRMVSREGPVLSTAERSRLIRRVVDEAVGLGVLEPLLADDSVTEIMVNGTDEIYVERNGRIERADIAFSDEAQLFQTIDRIVSTVNRRVDESSPMVDARLPTGERVNVIIPPLALRGPTMTIRRFPRLFTLDELVEIGSLDAADRRPAAGVRAGAAEHRHLRRHGRGQDDDAQRALGRRARRRPHHHRRGQRRAAPPAAARGHARGAPGQRRGQGRGHDPRPRAQLAAHAPGPDHRRRGPRRRDRRHAAGAQHRPRGLAGDAALQLLRRRDPPARRRWPR